MARPLPPPPLKGLAISGGFFLRLPLQEEIMLCFDYYLCYSMDQNKPSLSHKKSKIKGIKTLNVFMLGPFMF